MRLVADEGADGQIVKPLRADGHDVLYIAELDSGMTDDEVLERANGLGALLLTTDKDFGELIFRLRRIHAGVVLIRLEGLAGAQKAPAVSDDFVQHSPGLANAFTVVSPGLVRIRRSA